MNSIADIIATRAEKMMPIPYIVNEIIELIEGNKASAKDFEKLISRDPVLTMRVLKVANSAYYGYTKQISDLKEALVILGTSTLRSIIISLAVHKIVDKEVAGYGLKKGELWEHSLATAIIAKEIAQIAKLPGQERFFIGGLLHDIGKLVLEEFILPVKERIQKAMDYGELTLVEAERAIAEIDHCEAGAIVASRWNLPDILIEIIRHHHNSQKSKPKYREYVSVVEHANNIANNIKMGNKIASNKPNENDYGPIKIGGTTIGTDRIKSISKEALRFINLI